MTLRSKLFASHLTLVFLAVFVGFFLVLRIKEAGRVTEETVEQSALGLVNDSSENIARAVQQSVSGVLDIFAIAIVCGALVSLLLSWYFSRAFSRPILDLRSVMGDVAKGAVGRRLPLVSKDEFGELAKAFNIMADEVEEKRADIEKKIAEKTADLEKFKLALNNISDHVVITDANGLVVYGNKMVEKITGYPLEAALGKKAGKLWALPMPKAYYDKLWDTIKNKKQVFIGELQNRRKNGEVYSAVVSISPVLDEAGVVQFFVGIERDVTKEREIDRAKSEFVSLASHQLRTPLSAINWYVEMLLSGDAGRVTKVAREYLEEIRHGGKRMTELVGALLNVSRIEMGTFIVEPEPTDVQGLALEVIDELKPKILEKRLRIETNFERDFPAMLVDPKLIRIVFQNLLTNAVKYTPEEGRIALSLRLVPEEHRFSVEVSDTGYGIPKDEQGNVFSKLFRATNVCEKETDGTGLGLYIVKSIIEHSGGKIRFESEEGKGTTFILSFPTAGMERKKGTRRLEWKEEV